MTIKLYDNDIGNILLEKDYTNHHLLKDDNICETITYLDHSIGKASYHEIYFDGVHIGYGNASIANKILLHFESDFETIEMHFALKGKTSAISEGFYKNVDFLPQQHNIIYANQMRGKILWDSQDFQICEINLSPIFFKKFLPNNSILLDNFRNNIEQKNSSLLSAYNYNISYEMYGIINQIMQCKRKGIFKRMFLEAKVIELLLLQFEQSNENKFHNISLKKTDIDKIYAVKEFITNNLNETSTLIDLAHHVGTNEFTLKKGFKELFGTTVFGFWNDIKMEQAKVMLTELNMNVTEVSDTIGYKNARHFATAFKKKYGIIPSQLKKG